MKIHTEMIKVNYTNDAPNPYHLTILNQGVNVWNNWREINLQVIPIFHKANLSKTNLSYANFSKSQFNAANLSGAKLNGAAFYKAILHQANLSDSDLSGADFNEADLRQVDMTNANFHGTRFNKSELYNSKFNKSIIFATHIADSNCSQVDFTNAHFKSVDIQRSNFNNANFTNVIFHNTNFLASTLYGAIFIEAILNDVIMPGAYLHSSQFMNANLQGINLSGADLSNADLSGADLSNADLSNANLSNANLSNANLSNANLSDANLSNANLSNANLSDANLSNANLSQTILHQACLVRTKAIGTDFFGAELTGICIEDWNINKAKIDSVNCQYVYLKYPNEERCPIERDFYPREFTNRFRISQNILEISFTNGIPWKAFAYAFNETNIKIMDEYNDELFLQEYKVLGENLVVLKISYPPEANGKNIQEILRQRTYDLELKINQLQGEILSKDKTLEMMLERLLLPNSKQNRLYIDDIDSFVKVRNISIDSISHLLNNGYLNKSEEEIQIALEKILNELFHKKDWGGEYNDLYTSNLVVEGSRRATAFLLKGNGLRANCMEIKNCGKNGDQLLRLFESPAELFIIQFVGNISEAVIKDVEGKVELLRYSGKQVYYCIVNGVDTARLLYAYDLL